MGLTVRSPKRAARVVLIGPLSPACWRHSWGKASWLTPRYLVRTELNLRVFDSQRRSVRQVAMEVTRPSICVETTWRER